MSVYAPPLRDIRFALDHVLGLEKLSQLAPLAHADPATVHGLLEEFGRFCAEVIAPLNHIGDQQGCRHDPATGAVTTPDGWIEAYRQFVAAGWASVPLEPEHGGGGFPWLVGIAMQEVLAASNLAFSLCPMLTQTSIDMLDRWGSDEQKATYLPHLMSGDWSGTMNLTEPQAGSDVGASRTKAVPAEDGTWRISGTKIFITYGEHDLTDNIVHIVLARVPNAPPGTKGISCFIVPKFVVHPDGSLGERNNVSCVSIEHKLGIHASPTCVLSFDGAVGYLIGEPNDGMRYMFTMMNKARLSIGVEGLALAERSYQQAAAYAQERRQGNAIGAPPDEQSPIVDHPDVRRMLVTMRASIEAMRGVLYTTAWAIDVARHHPDPDQRAAHQELVDLLTPVSKAWPTDVGNEMVSIALQVHGGMGYIEETGVAQHFRDIRITPIYEGTNGIQAIDLVGRKLQMRGGGVVKDFLAQVGSLDTELAGAGAELASIRSNLAAGVAALSDATEWILTNGAADVEQALAAATPYLRLFGTVAGGWVLARQALAAVGLLAAGDGGDAGGGGEFGPDFCEAKVVTARFYAEQLLPQAHGLLAAVTAGKNDLLALSPEQLASS